MKKMTTNDNYIIESVVYLLESEDKEKESEKDKIIKKYKMAKRYLLKKKKEIIADLIKEYLNKVKEMKDKKGDITPFKKDLERMVKALKIKYNRQISAEKSESERSLEELRNEWKANKRVYLTAAAVSLGTQGALQAYKYYKAKKQENERTKK